MNNMLEYEILLYPDCASPQLYLEVMFHTKMKCKNCGLKRRESNSAFALTFYVFGTVIETYTVS